MQSYVTYTAHYITPGWKHQEKVLETAHMPEAHSGEDLEQAIHQISVDWKKA